MKKDDLISDDFLKQFKYHEELTSFLKQIQKRGIEKMLESELDGHLIYDKHQKSTGNNVRNGHSKKKIKTSIGESEITVPRQRSGCLVQSYDSTYAGQYGRWYRKRNCAPLCQRNEQQRY